MKKVTLVKIGSALAISGCLVQNAFANFGPCNYGKETVSSIRCFGPLDLNGTTVTGNVFVTGPIKATSSSIGSLRVMGPAKLNQTTISGDTKIYGPLEITDSTLKGSVFAASNEVVLTSSTVSGAVTIKSTNATPYLKLLSGSAVKNSVIFQGMGGIINEQGGSSVSGQVTNGSIG
jgi:hypothetical protein